MQLSFAESLLQTLIPYEGIDSIQSKLTHMYNYSWRVLLAICEINK